MQRSLIIIVVSAICAGAVLALLREVVCWYFKIGELIDLLKQQVMMTRALLKNKDISIPETYIKPEDQ